jgi:hypothetical protein
LWHLCGIISRLIGLFSPRHQIILNGQRKQERRKNRKNNPARAFKSEKSRHCHTERERGDCGGMLWMGDTDIVLHPF